MQQDFNFRQLALLVVIFLLSQDIWSAQILKEHNKDLTIIGSLAPGDADIFQEVLLRSKGSILIVDSPGGDVYEALRIGRLVRSRGLMVYVAEGANCHSSCVLLLAGGTKRAVFGSVGIHRPYFSVVDPDTDIKSAYRQMVDDIRMYLIEMNVPETLADTMMSVPPEETRLLTADDIALYFPADDPIADEIKTAKEAEERGISSAQLRQRRVAAESECAIYQIELDKAKNSGDDFSKMTQGLRVYFCKDAVTWGLSFTEYMNRVKIGNKACDDESISSDSRTECRSAILRGH